VVAKKIGGACAADLHKPIGREARCIHKMEAAGKSPGPLL